MISINFEPSSLLYGESCLWLSTFLLIPFQLMPDFKNTRNRHLLSDNSWIAERLLSALASSRATHIIQAFCVYCVTLVQVLYASLTIIYGSTVQANYLQLLKKQNPEELSYKCLYYTPILIKFATSLTLVASYIYRRSYAEWHTFDHFAVFSLGAWRQFKIMVCCVLLAVPDCVSLWVEMLFLITHLRSERYNLLQFTLRSREANLIFLACAMVVNTSSAVFKYKPVVIVIYSEICTALHLRLLHKQLHLAYGQAANVSQGGGGGGGGGQTRSIDTHSESGSSSATRLRARGLRDETKPDNCSWSMNQPHHTTLMQGQHRTIRMLKDSEETENTRREMEMIKGLEFRGKQKQNNRLALLRLKGANSQGEELANNMVANYRQPIIHTETITTNGTNSTPSAAPAVATRTNNKQPAQCQITCLFGFEKHLTQLYLFLAAIDQQTPSILYATLITNIMSIFYSILVLREIPAHEWSLLYAPLFLAGPSLPLVALFWWGHAIERECKQIATLIEVAHFQNTTQLLLYKQLKDSQYSLTRIFRLLDQIRLDCDHLMALNMKTLKRVVLYTFSAVFIVMQYDLLLATRTDAEDGDGGSANKTSFLATLGAQSLPGGANRSALGRIELHLFS